MYRNTFINIEWYMWKESKLHHENNLSRCRIKAVCMKSKSECTIKNKINLLFIKLKCTKIEQNVSHKTKIWVELFLLANFHITVWNWRVLSSCCLLKLFNLDAFFSYKVSFSLDNKYINFGYPMTKAQFYPHFVNF